MINSIKPNTNTLIFMKNFFKLIVLTLLASLAFVSCNNETTEQPDPEYKLEVNTHNITADGKETATFVVMYDDKDVTSEAVIRNATDQVNVEGSEFSTKIPKKYEFYAVYNDKISNIVEVTAEGIALTLVPDQYNLWLDETAYFKVLLGEEDVTNETGLVITNLTDGTALQKDGEGKYSFKLTVEEKIRFKAEYEDFESAQVTIGPKIFYKNAMMMRITGTWCGPCGMLSKNIDAAMGQYPDRLLMMAVHSQDAYSNADGNKIIGTYGSGSVPTFYFDMRKMLAGAYGASTIIFNIKDCVDNYPATCGFAIESEITGSSAFVKVKMTASEEHGYKLGIALLEDGIIAPQAGAESDYSHDNTLRKMGTDMLGEDVGVVGVRQEIEKTYSLSVSGYKAENLKVLVWATRDYDGKQYVVNAATCPINGIVDYRYE